MLTWPYLVLGNTIQAPGLGMVSRKTGEPQAGQLGACPSPHHAQSQPGGEGALGRNLQGGNY